jgi:hypothetical protein
MNTETKSSDTRETVSLSSLVSEWSGSRWFWWMGPFLASIILLGGASQLCHGLVGMAVAFALWKWPPSWTISKRFEKILWGMMGVLFLAFLPAWLLPNGDWRNLAIEKGITLPFSLALHPGKICYGVFWLLVVGSAFCWMLSQRPYPSERKTALWIFIFVIGMIGFFSIVGQLLNLKYWLSSSSTVFTFLPNRNHSATLFAMGGTAAFGMMLYQFRHNHVMKGIIACFFVVLFCAAVGFTTSRAGLILMLVGIMTAIFFGFPRFRNNRAWLIAFPALTVLMLVFVLTDIYRKLFFRGFFIPTKEYRWAVYQDAFAMIKDHWLSGVGWGHFEEIFRFYRVHSALDARALHPESDWMWLVTETGLIEFALLILMLVILCKALFPFSYKRYESVRAIGAAALIPFILHTFIDVPAHSLPVILSALFLYAVSWNWAIGIPSSINIQKWKILAVIIGFSGGCLVLNSLSKHFGEFTPDWVLAQKEGDWNKVLNALNDQIDEDPLNWRFYIERGKAIFFATGNVSAAKEDFKRAFFLEPSGYQGPYEVGCFWLYHSPKSAYSAWAQALKRSVTNPGGLYHDIWVATSPNPFFGSYLSALISNHRDFGYYCMMQSLQNKNAFYFEEQRIKDPLLQTWTMQQQFDMLRLAAQIEPQVIYDYLPEQQRFKNKTIFWELYFWSAGGSGRYEEASRIAASYISPENKFPTNVNGMLTRSELEERVRRNPNDWVSVNSLLQAQIQSQNWNEAINLLNILARQQPTAPYVFYWRANIEGGQLRNWEASWNDWVKYVEATKSLTIVLKNGESAPIRNESKVKEK